MKLSSSISKVVDELQPIFFILASGIKLKPIIKFFFNTLMNLLKFKKKNINTNTIDDLGSDSGQSYSSMSEKPQQSFSFEKTEKISTEKKVAYKLPGIDLLDKNESKTNKTHQKQTKRI